MSDTIVTCDCDALIIGAGPGGLLAAASLAARGKTVIVLERLGIPGGRCTAHTIRGYQVPTGAFHMAPYGIRGPLQQLITALGIDVTITPFPILGNVWDGGDSYPVHHPLDLRRVLSFSEQLAFGRLLLHAKCSHGHGSQESVADWLDRGRYPLRLRHLFNAFSQFALGGRTSQLPYAGFRAVMREIVHGGHAGLIRGGCKALTNRLVARIQERGGRMLLRTQATALLTENGRVTGAVVRTRGTEGEQVIRCRECVYNGSQFRLDALLGDAIHDTAWHTALPRRHAAQGIALHLACEEPLLSTEGITFCLGTRRIAGYVQPSLTDPSLAPAGKHLFSAFWVPITDNTRLEVAEAFEDLRQIFGPRVDRCCTVLRQARYQREWPVNHLRQGEDLPSITPIPGLFLVGDAVKPAGFPMLEGVAGSVQRYLAESDLTP